jgi:hypothetical protein
MTDLQGFNEFVNFLTGALADLPPAERCCLYFGPDFLPSKMLLPLAIIVHVLIEVAGYCRRSLNEASVWSRCKRHDKAEAAEFFDKTGCRDHCQVENRQHFQTASSYAAGQRWMTNDMVNVIASVIGAGVAILLQTV